jgi:iron complex transport system substrate-binding protein
MHMRPRLAHRAALSLAIALTMSGAPARGDASGSGADSGTGAGTAAGAQPPARIVSLDYCADQFVLKFAPRAAIAGLSPDADADFSYMRAAAVGLPVVRPRAEDVLIARPDLVVRSYGGGAGIAAHLARAGAPTLPIGFARSVAEVRANVLRIAAALGAPAAGEAAVRRMTARIAAAAPPAGQAPLSALYLTTGGWTTGPGTLVDELMTAAGLRNIETRAGWRPLPLERLARETPDLIATAFFDTDSQRPGSWSSARHPVTRAMLAHAPTVALKGAWTSCGGWFLADAVEALAAARDRVIAGREGAVPGRDGAVAGRAVR